MKLHRHREHHYVKKLTRLQAAGGLPVGVGVHQLDIRHDSWCRLYKGQRCNCDPDLRLTTIWTPRPQGEAHGRARLVCGSSPAALQARGDGMAT